MPNQQEVGNKFGLLARFVGVGRVSSVSMPMVAVIAVAASTLHAVEMSPKKAEQSVLAALAGQPSPAFDPTGNVFPFPRPAPAAERSDAFAVVSIDDGRQMASWVDWALAATAVLPTPATAAWPMAAKADARRAEVRRSESQLADVRPPLKLSVEQRNVASFVASKYRIAVDDVQHFVAHAYQAAREFKLDPYLVLAVVSIESSFNPKARSPKGAQGLMQVLTRVHTDKFAPFGGPTAAFDPVANLSVGSRILKEYLVREGSVEGALKSYVGAALLPHDFGYGRKVLAERERIAAAAAAARLGPGQQMPERPRWATAATDMAQIGVADRPQSVAQFPEAARTAATSGAPGESKAIPVFEVFKATPASDMPPPVSGDASGKDAVDQLLKNLSSL